MAMKNSALKVVVLNTRMIDVPYSLDMIVSAKFIENAYENVETIGKTDKNTTTYMFYTADPYALNRIVYHDLVIELLLGRYDDAAEFDRWLKEFDKTGSMFTMFLKMVTVRIITEIKATYHVGKEIHYNEDISDEALRPIIKQMEKYIEIVNILSEKYRSYYDTIQNDYFVLMTTVKCYAKPFTKEKWPILFKYL